MYFELRYDLISSLESVLNPVGSAIRTNPFIGPEFVRQLVKLQTRTRPRPNPGSSQTSRPIVAMPKKASESGCAERFTLSDIARKLDLDDSKHAIRRAAELRHLSDI